MPKSLISKLDHLKQRIESIYLATNDDLPQMEDALSGKGKLPAGCPSKESFAELIFRHVEKKLSYVNDAVKDIKEALPK